MRDFSVHQFIYLLYFFSFSSHFLQWRHPHFLFVRFSDYEKVGSCKSEFLDFCLDRTENPLRGLKNRYSYVGFDVTFTCVSPMRSCLGMNWYKHKEGTERETIFNGSTPTLYNTDKYTVRLVDSGCQLTVNNLELSDAGLIVCEIVTSPRSFEDTAFLLVFSKLCSIALPWSWIQ